MKIDEIFKKCTDLTMSKRHDYTSSIDNHENFKRSALIAEWFRSNDDKPYVVLIGTKLARLASLLDSKEPKNESIEDSFLDLINYCALWMERRTNHNEIINPGSIIKSVGVGEFTCYYCGSEHNKGLPYSHFSQATCKQCFDKILNKMKL